MGTQGTRRSAGAETQDAGAGSLKRRSAGRAQGRRARAQGRRKPEAEGRGQADVPGGVNEAPPLASSRKQLTAPV